MDKTKKYLAFSFVMVLVAVTIVSVIGMILLDRKPVVLQGQIEATEIRISGKLPGRIDRFLVEEGERVAAGDTLVVINSPEALAKYEQVQALEDVAVYQNQKIDDGTRRQIVESMKQLWVKAKADLKLARTTRERIESLYRDSVVTSQRRDEAEALCQLREALFLGSLGKVLIHIRPFVVLALGGGLQILGGVADALQLLEPELGVLLLVLRRFEEQGRDLLVALLPGLGGEESVFVAGLGFAGKGRQQIFLGLGTCVFRLFHGHTLLSVLWSPADSMCILRDFFSDKCHSFRFFHGGR